LAEPFELLAARVPNVGDRWQRSGMKNNSHA
jgi:hypothetical protein